MVAIVVNPDEDGGNSTNDTETPGELNGSDEDLILIPPAPGLFDEVPVPEIGLGSDKGVVAGEQVLERRPEDDDGDEDEEVTNHHVCLVQANEQDHDGQETSSLLLR